MPLAGTGRLLGDKIAAEIIAPDADPDVRQAIIARWEDIGDIIVAHILTNAQVSVDAGIPVATTGASGPQNGATTGPGTGVLV
jgi:hypothetical protein